MSCSMSSSSSSASRTLVQGYGSEKICGCGLRARRWTSWTDANPGRRFFGCPKYNTGDEDCKFFQWQDEEMSKRAKEVIIEQRDKCKSLSKENADLIGELELLSHENLELKKEMEIVKSDNTELKDENMYLWNAVELVKCENIKLSEDIEYEKTENMELKKSLEIIRRFIRVDYGGGKRFNKRVGLIVICFGLLLLLMCKFFQSSEIGFQLPMLG